MATVVVHMIGNAHLDPVWLWPWERGADEAIATCRSACDLLDEIPHAIFTRGEAWVYEQVRAHDPTLFARVRGHVEALRWSVVNGWWVQPDANLPTEEALQVSARLGLDWFKRHLGLATVPVAYLVDSFGHGAYLPRVIRNAGQRYFVMMRPMRHEKSLPSELFRWRSPDGAEVLTWRVQNAYALPSPDNGALARAIEQSLAAPRPQGVDHVMCFYGVGNHGGGPTRKLVRWIAEHQGFAPGVRLEFSSPERFFASVEALSGTCPVVEGELLHHAIGCYSVCGRLKREVRAAELAATDVEQLAKRREIDLSAELEPAWKTLCFNQFHDIIAGSSVADATDEAQRQVGGARDAIARVTHTTLRSRMGIWERPLAGHRVHVVNRCGLPWNGLADIELFPDLQGFDRCLWSEKSGVVLHQRIAAAGVLAERGIAPLPRLLFPVSLAPYECQSFLLREPESNGELPRSSPQTPRGELDNGMVRVAFSTAGIEQIYDGDAPMLARPISLVVIADGSDTWSHGIDRYHGPVQACAEFGAPGLVEHGLLRTVVRLTGRIGSSRVRMYVSLDRNSRRVDVRLDLNYQEPFSVLKASIGLLRHDRPERRDRVAGGWIERRMDGLEYPVHHAIRLRGDTAVGVLFPDSFAADCSSGNTVRITLIRNSIHAFHSNARVPHDEIATLADRFGTDEGPQSIRFSLLGGNPTEAEVESQLAVLQRPPWVWDDYRGVSRVQAFERT